MKTLTRKIWVFSTVIILAILLSGARGLPTRTYNECERNTSWSIWSVLDDRQTSDTVGGKTTETQDVSSRSEQHSSRGEETTDTQINRVNPDGSTHDHEETTYSDPEGKGCSSDGIPQKSRHSRDDDTDSKGNRKEHAEEIIEKNGKCVKNVRDWEWDAKGKLIKDTGWVSTDVPCSMYNLEVLYKGSIDVTHSIITYGPSTAVIQLEDKGDSYAGKLESVFDAKMTGKCNGSGTFPVFYEVTATKEDEFGEMDFIVKETKGASAVVACMGKSGTDTEPTKTKTYTFKLTAEDGASITFTIPPGYIALTFTLKKK
jgi:hypothetical protein